MRIIQVIRGEAATSIWIWRILITLDWYAKKWSIAWNPD